MFEWPSLSQQEQQTKCRNGAKTNAAAAGNGFKFQDEEEERFNNIFGNTTLLTLNAEKDFLIVELKLILIIRVILL